MCSRVGSTPHTINLLKYSKLNRIVPILFGKFCKEIFIMEKNIIGSIQISTFHKNMVKIVEVINLKSNYPNLPKIWQTFAYSHIGP